MIAKFSKINLDLEDQESDSKDDAEESREFQEFYSDQLWLDEVVDDSCNSKICLINKTQQTPNPAQYKELSHPPATGLVSLFNSLILMFNQKDNRITVSKVAVERAPMMKFFVNHVATKAIMDTGAESSVISESRARQ